MCAISRTSSNASAKEDEDWTWIVVKQKGGDETHAKKKGQILISKGV